MSEVGGRASACETDRRPMLFPTVTFAIFFMVVLPVSWLLMPRRRRWKLFMIAASYYFYGYWNWRFCFLIAASTIGNQLFAKGHRPRERRAQAAAAADRRGHRQPRAARVLQVLRLLHHVGDEPAHTGRHRRRAADRVGHAAGRHLVLHVPGAQLRDRRVPRHVQARSGSSSSRCSCRSSRTWWRGRSCGPPSSCPSSRNVTTPGASTPAAPSS